MGGLAAARYLPSETLHAEYECVFEFDVSPARSRRVRGNGASPQEDGEDERDIDLLLRPLRPLCGEKNAIIARNRRSLRTYGGWVPTAWCLVGRYLKEGPRQEDLPRPWGSERHARRVEPVAW